MLSLSNNQLKYLAYFVMALIVIVLLLNIFLTKINNNYNNARFENFINMNSKSDKKENKTYNALDTTLMSNKENVKNISRTTLENLKKTLVLNEVEYINDQINEHSKKKLDINTLTGNEQFSSHIDTIQNTFKYIDYLIDNYDKAKK